MTNRQHAEREITRREGLVMAQDDANTVWRVRFPHIMAALNAYDALVADVASVQIQEDTRDLVVVF